MSSDSSEDYSQLENEEVDEKNTPEKESFDRNDKTQNVPNASKPIRFLRLFEPKKSQESHIWRGVSRVLKKKSYKPIRCSGFDLKFGATPLKDTPEVHTTETQEIVIVKEKSTVEPTVLKSEIALWRHGPAKLWYDALNTPDDGEGFSYGFKLGEHNTNDAIINPIPDEAFLMMNQLQWEKDIIWDGNDVKTKIENKFSEKQKVAGWLPSRNSRTVKQNLIKKIEMLHEETWYSLFPIENDELIYSKWEDDVIWDSQAMIRIPVPKIPTIDLNDENIIMNVPEDIDPADNQEIVEQIDKIKRINPHEKSTRILLSKAGLINYTKNEFIPRRQEVSLDPFNISNDRFYSQVTENSSRVSKVSKRFIQHATPIVKMVQPFITTHMDPTKLRLLNRPRLNKFSHRSLNYSALHDVLPLLKHINRKKIQREQERINSGGGQMFQMRTSADLSGCDGELILVEFCEEYPPLMSAIGMCSKMINYYQGKLNKVKDLEKVKFGEPLPAQLHTFQGSVDNGQFVQALENNLYRVPIFEHKIPTTDFLIIRTEKNYFIREFNALYTAGQQCPLMEVPRPTSKPALAFTRDFIRLFIYRLFWKSQETPRIIKIDIVKDAFPDISEGFIRKILKRCADCKRFGTCTINWVLKSDFRLPSEDELCELISPEQYCAYFSMLSAQQRLKDAGYGEKIIFAEQLDEDEEEKTTKMDDEVRAAPWNTTKAYLESLKGKCILQLHGPADPTGCGEGFSYVKLSKRNQIAQQEFRSKKISAEGDLRRMKVSEARSILREHGLRQDAIKKLSRWEIVAAVRTLSTEKTKAGEGGLCKYSRINSTITEVQERYLKDCQNLFELQNTLLQNAQVLSTDDDDSTESEDSDIEELGKNLELMLSQNVSSTQLSFEREEQERRELLEWMADNNANKLPKIKEDVPASSSRILRITRTMRDESGREYSSVEIVRKSSVIDLYVKIRTTKDEKFIKHYSVQDEGIRLEMRRERRNIMAQLRTIKRNEDISAEKKISSVDLTGETNDILREETSLDNSNKTKKKFGSKHCDYLDNNRTSKRARKNPCVEFSQICDQILLELSQISEYEPFVCPVSTRVYGYSNIIKKPMDLQTMRDKLKDSKYSSRDQFLADVVQIVENSKLFNGAQSYLTLAAQQMLQNCVEKLTEQEDKLMLLEFAIDPGNMKLMDLSKSNVYNGDIIDVGSEEDCLEDLKLAVVANDTEIPNMRHEDCLEDMEFSDTDEDDQ
ncbi:unnamed protein product [Diamesa serratosioi]